MQTEGLDPTPLDEEIPAIFTVVLSSDPTSSTDTTEPQTFFLDDDVPTPRPGNPEVLFISKDTAPNKNSPISLEEFLELQVEDGNLRQVALIVDTPGLKLLIDP